jgi:hypothetical protein
MSRGGTLILLGTLTILVPFSGLPIAFRTALLILLGMCVCAVGFTLRSQESVRARESEQAVTATV